MVWPSGIYMVGNLPALPPTVLVAPNFPSSTSFLPKGRFPSIRHNEIRDLTANLLTEVCHDMYVEPNLQPITSDKSFLERPWSLRTEHAWTQQQVDTGREGLRERTSTFEYVFSKGNIVGPYGIFSTYPWTFIGLEQTIRDVEGVLIVEEGESMINPLSLREMVRNFVPYTSDCMFMPVPILYIHHDNTYLKGEDNDVDKALSFAHSSIQRWTCLNWQHGLVISHEYIYSEQDSYQGGLLSHAWFDQCLDFVSSYLNQLWLKLFWIVSACSKLIWGFTELKQQLPTFSRFASHPRYPYWALNMKQRHQLLSQAKIYLRHNLSDANLPTEELREMMGSFSADQLMKPLQQCAAKVQVYSQHWFHKLQALLEKKGAPTFFRTVSSGDNYWPKLHSLMLNTTNDPTHLMCVQAVFPTPTSPTGTSLQHWLYDTLDAEWHWYRFEYQACGSTHAYGCAKLKNNKGICTLVERVATGWLVPQEVQNLSARKEFLRAVEEGC